MTAGNALIIVAVVFGIVGTVLSIRGLARLLSAAAASIKRKATSGLYIFTLRQLYENVVHKYISVSVASILIMLTIMLITDGSVSIMSYGKQITRGSSVYDLQLWAMSGWLTNIFQMKNELLCYRLESHGNRDNETPRFGRNEISCRLVRTARTGSFEFAPGCARPCCGRSS